jgi:signal transduction histidine kinase
MVKNYLNLSRLEKGTLRYNPEPVDVRQNVILPVLERLQRWLDHSRFDIRWDWPQEVIVFADAALLDIVYSNFIVNALKYGKEWLEFSARREGKGWVLTVANGGTPIPAEKIPMLFKKFSRLVGSSDGAGLGLYLVQKIVERHGGEVWCESDDQAGTHRPGTPQPGTPRPGTRFSMRLPAAPDAV